MKRTGKWIISLLAVTVAALLFICSAGATSSISGDTGASTTFYVQATGGDAYIKLYSYAGNAHITKNGQDIGYLIQKDKEEENHGFYSVTVSKNGYSATYDWAPSASYLPLLGGYNSVVRERGTETSRTLMIYFPGSGKYKVTVIPYGRDEINKYWNLDSFNYWIENATWTLDKESGCSCSYSDTDPAGKPATITVNCYDRNGNYLKSYQVSITSSQVIYPASVSGYHCNASQYVTYYTGGQCSNPVIDFYYEKDTPVTGTVTVYCYDDNGNLIDYYDETISQSQYISPSYINGYKLVSSAEYVRFSNGSCNPSSIYFYYEALKPEPEPDHHRPSGRVVTPYNWDTQFKPGTTEPGKYNENRYKRLDNVHDDNFMTSFEWLIWSSEASDGIPELTAYFNGETVSSIGIRNGYLKNESEYYQYARASGLRVMIYDHKGREYTAYLDLPDYYDTEYRVYSLGGTYKNVSRIEIWLDTYYSNSSADNNHRNVIHIADIRFYN